MPPVQLDEQQARILQGSKNVLDKMLQNPKTKYQAERLIKENFPDATTTVDRAAPFINRMNTIEAKLDTFIKGETDTRADARMNAAFDVLRGKPYNFTFEGIEKIKEVMVKEKIANPLAAAAWWEKQNPPTPQEPSVFAPNSWGFNAFDDKDESSKLLWKDEDRWAEVEAGRALKDYRQSQRDLD
jgi:hypothetical protein